MMLLKNPQTQQTSAFTVILRLYDRYTTLRELYNLGWILSTASAYMQIHRELNRGFCNIQRRLPSIVSVLYITM